MINNYWLIETFYLGKISNYITHAKTVKKKEEEVRSALPTRSHSARTLCQVVKMWSSTLTPDSHINSTLLNTLGENMSPDFSPKTP